MGLLGLIVDVVKLPVAVAVDGVRMPFDVLDGKTPLRNTRGVLDQIEDDLEDD